jgi:hypothetical protein
MIAKDRADRIPSLVNVLLSAGRAPASWRERS